MVRTLLGPQSVLTQSAPCFHGDYILAERMASKYTHEIQKNFQ